MSGPLCPLFLFIFCWLVQGLGLAQALESRLVWTDPWIDVEGTVSGDGRYLSFVDWRSGDLAVRDLRSGQSRRLTGKDSWESSPEFAGPSALSRDGKWVAYAWFQGQGCCYDLRVIRTDGSSLRVVYRDDEVFFYQPRDWSPDGTDILTAVFGRDGLTRMALVPAGGGEARILKTLGVRYPGRMSFSPDGRSILYEYPRREDAVEHDLFLLSVETGGVEDLVTSSYHDYNPVWSRDGKRVIFLSDRAGPVGLWSINVAPVPPAGAPRLLKSDVGDITAMGLSRDGSYYFAVYAEVRKILVAEIDRVSGQIASRPESVTDPRESVYSGPAWSPDGHHLAYVSQRGGPLPLSASNLDCQGNYRDRNEETCVWP